MSEWDDKLNQILSDPNTMGQIMSIASSLSGSGAPSQAAPPESVKPEEPPASLAALLGGGSTPLSGLDPALLGRLSQLLGEWNRTDDNKAALLAALRPFLRPERSAQLDKMIQLTRLSRVARLAIQLFRGEDSDV